MQDIVIHLEWKYDLCRHNKITNILHDARLLTHQKFWQDDNSLGIMQVLSNFDTPTN